MGSLRCCFDFEITVGAVAERTTLLANNFRQGSYSRLYSIRLAVPHGMRYMGRMDLGGMNASGIHYNGQQVLVCQAGWHPNTAGCPTKDYCAHLN